jgi:hypothetical protein
MRIITSEQDTIDLQNDIDAAAEWSHKWLLPFNIDKCKVMHVGRPGNRSTNFYTMPDVDGTFLDCFCFRFCHIYVFQIFFFFRVFIDY